MESRLRRGAAARFAGRGGQVLVAAQLACALALLTGLVMAVRSGLALDRVDRGFSTQAWTARLTMLGDTYRDQAARARFVDAILRDMRSGQAPAAATSALPLEPARPVAVRTTPHTPGSVQRLARRIAISDGLFDLLEAPLIEGRDFTAHDRAGALPVAIVNRQFVREHFPDGAAVGRQLWLQGPGGDNTARTIVAVAPDLWVAGEANHAVAGVYVPYAQMPLPSTAIIAAASPGSGLAVERLRDVVSRIDRRVPVHDVHSLQDVIDRRTGHHHLFSRFQVALGALALLIALFGIHSVAALSVAQRTRDIAVRLALGATPAAIRRAVWHQLRPAVGAGLALGLPAASAFGGTLSAVLYESPSIDSWWLTGVALAAGLTAWTACQAAARRVTRVDPASALR